MKFPANNKYAYNVPRSFRATTALDILPALYDRTP
jgi:hypothetical protein